MTSTPKGPQIEPEDRCSFCGKMRIYVRKLFAGQNGMICDTCVRLAASPFATIATCSGCKPVNGKHVAGCANDEAVT